MRLIQFRLIAASAAFLLSCLPSFATPAAPSTWPAPYACLRNFSVAVGGSTASNCGSSGSPCGSLQSANDATSIGNTGTTLTGGDCVNVAPGVYNTTGTIQLNRSGSNAHQNAQGLLTGYIAYVGAPNHASVINYTSNPGGSGINPSGNFIAFDGFDVAGNSLTPTCLWGQGGSHHFWVLNGLFHDSGGCGIGGGGNGDYFFYYHNEVYNTSWLASNAQSGISIFEPRGSDLSDLSDGVSPADTQNFRIQVVGNVAHENSCNQANVGLAGGHDCGAHSDGNAIIMDDFSNAQENRPGCTYLGECSYPHGTLLMGNLTYHNGGRGVYMLGAGGFTAINNTAYDNCHDLAPGCGDVVNIFGIKNSVIENNIAWTTFNGVPAFFIGTSGGRPSTGNVINNNLAFDGTPGHTSAFSIGGDIGWTGSNPLIGVDPKLVSVPTNFHPVTGSPVIGAGLVVAGLPASISTPDGQNQASPPNVGAFVSTGSNSPSGPISINAGGPAAGNFVADTGFSGGQTISNNPSNPVDVSLVTNPAPLSVYRTERYGTFSYATTNLTPMASYMVNLHFTEDFAGDEVIGQRLMDIGINGTNVLSGFDIFGATLAANKAIVKSFTAHADANGSVAVSFGPHAGSPDQSAKVDGVEILGIVANGSGNFGYSPGLWYTLDNPVPSFAAPTPHAPNTIRCAPASMRNTATISSVATRVYTADPAGHVKFAIYANGGNNRPSTLVTSSTSMPTTPAGTVITTSLAANAQGGPGGANMTDKFWFCSNTDSATASFVSVSANGGTASALIGGSTAENILESVNSSLVMSHLSCAGAACAGASSTFGTFPASLVGSTWTEQTSTNMPMMAVQFVSVP